MTTTRTKQVGVRVTPEVWGRVRLRCLERGESASALVERLLVEWLSCVTAPMRPSPDRPRPEAGTTGITVVAEPATVKRLTYERED